MKLVLLLSART